MGEVYLAEDTRLHRKVTLKVLPADLASHRDRMRRFEQEATATAALNHPNIVPFMKSAKASAFISSRWNLSRIIFKRGQACDLCDSQPC